MTIYQVELKKMETFNWKALIQPFDQRRHLIIPGNTEETILFSVHQFIQIGHTAIQDHGSFSVALSGGQTPHAIFKELNHSSYQDALDWSKVLCFWSDERSVPPLHPENNYSNALQAGLVSLPLLSENIFRMKAEENIEANAAIYEQLIQEKVPSLQFDLMMLGMGEDGHTASLFPHTNGLHAKDRLVIANYVPQKDTWRMSLTYTCINQAKHICIYAMGSKKADRVAQVLLGPDKPDQFPVQHVGTLEHPALWILDQEASKLLN